MNTHPDFEELLRLLEENGVEYMIVGGYAVAFHGYPRFTKDIDVFYKLDAPNVERLLRALKAFGFGEVDLPEGALSVRGEIITFGISPVRVDLLNEIDGVSFEEARPNIVRGTYGNVKVAFIGREDLLRNKRSTPRARDKADVEELE
jgi:predicted nucleotidyltransferase